MPQFLAETYTPRMPPAPPRRAPVTSPGPPHKPEPPAPRSGSRACDAGSAARPPWPRRSFTHCASRACPPRRDRPGPGPWQTSRTSTATCCGTTRWLLGTLLAEERRHPELLEVFRTRLAGPRRTLLHQALADGITAGELPGSADPDVLANLLIGSFYARYIATSELPQNWPNRALGSVWPDQPPGTPRQPLSGASGDTVLTGAPPFARHE